MKILVLNGSPRKGNTVTAINAFAEGAKDKNEIVFIEVKTRCQKIYGSPSEAVDRRKKRHIYHVAEFYLIINKLENAFCRIDVIEVYFKDEKIFVNHIKNSVQDRPFKDKFQIFEEDYDFEIE